MHQPSLLRPIAMLAFFGCFSSIAPAALITYDFRGGSGPFDFDANSGTFTDTSGGIADGLMITLQSFLGGVPDGQVNTSSNGLGVRSDADGASDEFNGYTPSGSSTQQHEAIVFSFAAPATIGSIQLTNLNLDDSGSGELSIGGSTAVLGIGSNGPFPVHGNLDGNSFEVIHVSGSGFNIRTMQLDITPAAVPEPGTILMLGLSTAAGMLVRRRRRDRKGFAAQ